jgi:hypothetical protein
MARALDQLPSLLSIPPDHQPFSVRLNGLDVAVLSWAAIPRAKAEAPAALLHLSAVRAVAQQFAAAGESLVARTLAGALALDPTQIVLPRRHHLAGSSEAADLLAFPVAVKRRGVPGEAAQLTHF